MNMMITGLSGALSCWIEINCGLSPVSTEMLNKELELSLPHQRFISMVIKVAMSRRLMSFGIESL
jgi:hypothetical protein